MDKKQFIKDNKWTLISLAWNTTFAILLGKEAVKDARNLLKKVGGN